MRSAKGIITACLTATMVFQMFAPSTAALAAEVDAASNIAAYVGGGSGAVEGAESAGSASGDGDSSSSASGTPVAGGTESGSSSADSGESTGSASGAGSGSAASGSESSTAGSESANAGAAQGDAAQDAAASEDAAQQDATSAAAAGATITTLKGLQDALAIDNSGSATGTGDVADTITVNDSRALIVISNTDPKIYQNAKIVKGGSTGSGFDVSAKTADGYEFQGFGSDAYPFKGSIEIDSSIGAARTFYNNIELSDANATAKLTWKGTSCEPIVANKVTGNGKKLDAQVTIADPVDATGVEESTAGITGSIVGSSSGALTLKASYSFTGKRKGVGINPQTGNAGLLVNTIENGTLTIDSVTGLGRENVAGTPTVSAATANGCAGGLIGCVNDGASVSVNNSTDNNSIDVSAFTVSTSGDNGYAGGFIGKATNLTLTILDNVSIKPAQKVGSASTTYAGGAFGFVSFAGEFTVKQSLFDFGDAVIQLGATKRAGGLFGSLDVTKGDVTVQGGTYKSKLTAGADNSGADSGARRGSYGGLAGNVYSTVADPMHALVANRNNDDSNSAVTIEIERASNLCYVGGVVGYLGDNSTKVGNAAAVLNGVQITCRGSAKPYTGNGKYGGAIGVVDSNNILDVRDFKLDTDGAIGENTGGSAGIAGSAWQGVIKFSGVTDLSGAKFADSDSSAQLVYQNYNALIFAAGSGSDSNADAINATGWKFVRSDAGTKTDDIHDYGEVVRLGNGNGLSSNLVSVDKDTHKLALSSALNKSSDGYTLSSADDFAKMAITWQTSGYYSLVSGVSSASALASATIEIAGTIELAGTGLTGLTKDNADGAGVFSGTLKGSGTINLAVGEPYGMRGNSAISSDDTSDGNGKIYRHARLGLFATVQGATVQGVTIGGTMRFENGTAIDAGALAGTMSGNVSLSGATFNPSIAYNASYSGDNKVMQVGGIAGSVSDAATVTFDSNTQAKANIASRANINSSDLVQSKAETRVGGVIGYVTKDKASTFSVAGLTIGGSVTAGDSDSGKAAQIGGFIGSIGQGDGNVLKNVTITGLVYNDFNMSVGRNGDRKNGAGGLLGYSWGNAIVTIGSESASNYALTANNTSVTASNATEFGGLLYAMSGHFIIQDKAIDISGASLSASSATSFGVLLARGACDSTFGVESYKGLYLEDRAEWETAYLVPGNGKISASNNVQNFDEWVALTTKTGSTTSSGGCNAVVSLHTTGEKLYMGNVASEDNSYKNRTDVGLNHKTNQNARYYYNLDRCLSEAAPNGDYGDPNTLVKKPDGSQFWVKSPQALMIWSACRYAPEGIYEYIAPGLGFKSGITLQIGNTDPSAASYTTMDLDGYSYYPVDSNAPVSIKNSTIKFCYTDIKNEQTSAGNKSNADFTQHANMHLSLFRAVSTSFTTENLTLSGSVGRVVDGSDPTTSTGTSNSGALICRSIEGSSSNIATVSFTKGLVLDGLSVDGAEKGADVYAPLLINDLRNYITLDVQQLSIEKDSYGKEGSMKLAASSLFGKLGLENSDQINASLHGDIELPSRIQSGYGIFTRASFFDSFGYGANNTGSANYIFNTNDRVTYGEEIDSKGTEAGKQLWYYDAPDYGNVTASDGSLVTDGDITANSQIPQFGSKYLPYVYNRNAENPAYREIKVNQKAAHLETGCGTYSDPYAVKSAQELYTLTNYINSADTAVDGWRITITTDQNQMCTRRSDKKSDYEATYQFSYADGRIWKKVAGSAGASSLDNTTMHLYAQSAYYSIEPADTATKTIEVDAKSFGGFGSRVNPFRGVIVGNLTGTGENGKIVIKNGTSIGDTSNSGTISGLIPYSYGSVIKDLDIKYAAGISTVTYAGKDNDGVPKAFFGGVIGCIMGGDNIIDGVNVESTTVQSVPSGSDALLALLSGETNNSNLVPIGGYVGAIAGGGVIFRNTDRSWKGSSWNSSAKDNKKLYSNPYVGRVIDGYAFSEDCDVDNGNDNYQINKLDDSYAGHIITSDTFMAYNWSVKVNKVDRQCNKAATVQVDDAKGLLILSAIINSGAAAGAASTNNTTVKGSIGGAFRGSKAYEGRSFDDTTLAAKKYKFGNEHYGKVRNASYKQVGSVADDGEWASVKKDDTQAPGNQIWQGPLDSTDAQYNADQINSPYLVKRYANWNTGYVCASGLTGVNLTFKQGMTYDMAEYGTGYLGLSGRYYSNACSSADRGTDRQRISLPVACITGNNATIKANSNVKEYVNDDYAVSGVGTLFGNITFASDHVSESIAANGSANVTNLNFVDCSVSLSYVYQNGSPATNQTSDTVQVGVGCLAGVTSNISSQSNYGVYKNVVIDHCTVKGGASAGGLIGSTGYVTIGGAADLTKSKMVTTSSVAAPVKLTDCQYKNNSSITAEANAGGFIGKLANSGGSSFTVDVDQLSDPVGSNSTVRSTSRWAQNNEACTVGGMIALTNAPVTVGNATDISNDKRVEIRDVTVTSDREDGGFANTRGLGGVVGRAENTVNVNHVSIESTKDPAGESSVYFGSIAASAQTTTSDKGKDRYMDVGGIVGCTVGNVNARDCDVSKIRIVTRECSGGIVGVMENERYGNPYTTFTGDGLNVDSVQVDGAYSGGILGQDTSDKTVNVSNSIVRNSVFKEKGCWWTDHPDGQHTYSGGIVGDTKGSVSATNILVSKNTFDDPTHQGLLFGDVAPGDISGIRVAGLDVELADGQTTESSPKVMHCRNRGSVAGVNQKTYIAFGHYSDDQKFDGIDGSGLYNDERAADGSEVAVSAASPWVTTSPMATTSTESPLTVKASDSATPKRLFGDGAVVDTAATIKSEAGTQVGGHYTYTNIGGCNKNGTYQNTNDYNASTSKSMFNASNSESAKQAASDFPVLLIPGNGTTTVTNYLNLVTNGGFSDAVRLNSANGTKYVTATAETFQINENKEFVKSADAPSLAVVNNGANDMQFRASRDWDNEKGRFTLLTVTFNDGANHTYKVQVPIVVKRMLEINFAATYTYGTNYKSANYDSLTGHVLTSAGDAMTGYLTWTYNKAGNSDTEYGWNTHLESGGSMKPLNKTIDFSGTAGTLPAGTQLTLIDVAHNSKEYHYTVPAGGASSVALTSFKDSDEPNANYYQEPWLSETMGVKATQNNSGEWFKLPDGSSDGAGVKVDGAYYRVAVDGDAEDSRYNLTVNDESPKNESFYLVVRVPEGTPESPTKTVNGYTGTSVTSDVNTHINYVLRKSNDTDGHENTASTYSVASSYQQTLVDNNKPDSGESTTLMGDGATNSLGIDVTDNVSFGANEYNDGDSLYYQLDSSLANYKDGALDNAGGYPVGTSGTVDFYVKVGDEYYRWDGSTWKSAGTDQVSAVGSQEWTADGSDMSLTLARDGNAVDLREIRKIAKDHGSAFSIQMKAALTMTGPACRAAIAASQDGSQAYTKPSYRSFLSPHAETLSTSSMTADNSGGARYYRKDIGYSTIGLVSTKKTQLGINVNDLSTADGTIALVGTYDLSKLTGADAKLANATKVTYTLSLQKRAEDGSYQPVDYNTVDDNISKYLQVKESDKLGTGTVSGNTIVFTDEKKDGKFATLDGDSLAFKHRFVVKVNTDIESSKETYANYRLVLTAHMEGGGVDDTPKGATDAATNSDFVTYTITKVKMDGIDHSGQTN